jgi:drug/metabolite transporter (DMT)-like permease
MAHRMLGIHARPSAATTTVAAPVPAGVLVNDRAAFAPSDWALFVLVAAIWGSSFLLIKVGLSSFDPGFITWARVALGAAALSLLPRSRIRIDPADRGRMLWLSILWVAIPFTMFPLAERVLSSAVTGLLTGATPLFTGVVGGLLFDRMPRGPQRLGIAVGLVGVTMVSVGPGTDGRAELAGVAMVLAAALCYGIATNLAGPLQQRYGSVPVMARMLVLATVFTAPLGVHGAARSTFSAGPAVAVVVLGVVGTGLAFVLMASLVGSVGGPRASFVTYLIPLVALALGATVMGEQVARIGLVGAALVISGAVLASRTER